MLYGHPHIYDSLYGHFSEDIPFYLDLARSREGPVCELACGSGRVTVPLALEGVEILGIDSSPHMIAAAERRARAHWVPAGRIAFAEGDMRSPPDDGRFGLVIIPLHSLSHLHETADVRACLSGVRGALRQGGLFAFAVHNPDPAVLSRPPEGIYPIHGDTVPSAYESVRYDGARQLLHLSWYIENDDETVRFDYSLRMFFPLEIVALLEWCGFRIVAQYGWYDRSPFVGESGTHIIVARRD